MNRNSLGVVSGAGAGAERSGGERSEPQRSGAPVPAQALPAASHPDPEVVARPQRRSYTAEYKVRILREAVTLAPNSALAWRILGYVSHYAGLTDPAEAAWHRARDLDPSPAQAYWMHGRMLLYQGHYRTVKRFYFVEVHPLVRKGSPFH